jgi:hypothetical protein
VGCEEAAASVPAYAYIVEAQQGEWAHVKTSGANSKEGWLRIGAPFRGQPLSAFLPELHLAKAMVAYMEARQGVIKLDPTSTEQLVSRYAELAGNGSHGAEVLGWEQPASSGFRRVMGKGTARKLKALFNELSV